MRTRFMVVALALLVARVPGVFAADPAVQDGSPTPDPPGSRSCSFTEVVDREVCACRNADLGLSCSRFKSCVAYHDKDGELCGKRCVDCAYVCTHAPCSKDEG